MKYVLMVFVSVILLGLGGCNHSRRIYTSPTFEAAARQHKTIAILPFDVQVGLRPNQMKRLSPEQHYDLELNHGRAVQSSFQLHFMNKINRESEKVTVQDVMVTNALLKEHDIQPEETLNYPPAELAQLLGVDAVMVGSIITDKPVSNAVATALFLYTLFYSTDLEGSPPTNLGTTTIKIFDGHSGNLLWSYDKFLSRGLGSDTRTIVKAITRKASKTLPYAKLKVSSAPANSLSSIPATK